MLAASEALSLAELLQSNGALDGAPHSANTRSRSLVQLAAAGFNMFDNVATEAVEYPGPCKPQGEYQQKLPQYVLQEHPRASACEDNRIGTPVDLGVLGDVPDQTVDIPGKVKAQSDEHKNRSDPDSPENSKAGPRVFDVLVHENHERYLFFVSI
jgi:hypothetical protein